MTNRLLVILFATVLVVQVAWSLPPQGVPVSGYCELGPSPIAPLRSDPPLLSPQPDTLFWDNGTPNGIYLLASQWARVRFTAPYPLDLRSIYFIGNNPRNSASPCSVFVHGVGSGGVLGPVLAALRLPGNVVHFGTVGNPLWNDVTLPAPVSFDTGDQFFVVIGPGPGGAQHQGWHVMLDQGASGYSSISGSHWGTYNPTTNGDFIIRAGVADDNQPPVAYVSLISSQPPEWYYALNWVSGTIHRLVFTRICEGTVGEVRGPAGGAGWTVTNHFDSVVFESPQGLAIGVLDTFVLSHPTCQGHSRWMAGDSAGFVDGPLLVELLSFTAEPAAEAIRLRFATASERNNAHFELWRSLRPDGDFRLLARLNSRGDAQTRQDYEYLDRTALPGTTCWYYLASVSVTGERLEHRDLLRSARAQAAALPEEFSLAAHPNPFNPATTLTLTLPEAADVHLQVFDVAGRLVRELALGRRDAGRHTVTFDAGALPTGLYLARARAGTFTRSQKLLLVK